MVKYQRTVQELQNVASMFWPAELATREAKLSIIPTLVQTQDKFLSILQVEIPAIDNLFNIVEQSTMSANLFVKHLMVLADIGGEFLQRINSEFEMLYPDGMMTYIWKNMKHTYQFKELPLSVHLTNKRLSVSGKTLFDNQRMNDLYRDVIALLVLGAASVDEYPAQVLSKCEISDYLGDKNKLASYVRERYIWVSRITGGAKSNNLGQLVQKFVQEYLEDELADTDIDIVSNGHLPGVTHTSADDDRETTFDIVATYNEKYIGIEVSFQVTTNSVIERKAGQAQARYGQIHAQGYRIAYVLDGAGNFQRKNALKTLCNYSDCTVAFSQSELDLLCDYIRTYLGN